MLEDVEPGKLFGATMTQAKERSALSYFGVPEGE